MKRPNTETLALLDAARHAHGDCTDYRIARLLNVPTSYLSAWRRGNHLSDEYAARLAELAGMDPVETVLRVAADREGGVSADIFRRALARLTGAAASILLAVLLGVGMAPEHADAAIYDPAAHVANTSAAAFGTHAIYYVKWIMGAVRGRLRRLLTPCLAFAL